MQSNFDPRYASYSSSPQAGWQPPAQDWQTSEGLMAPAPPETPGWPQQDAAQDPLWPVAYPLQAPDAWQPYPMPQAPYAPPTPYPPGLQPPSQYPQPTQAYGQVGPVQIAYGLAPVDPVNPLQAPLAPGILGASDASASTGAAALAMDLAGTLFATNLAGKTNGVNLAGGGFAMGGSFVPTAASRLEVLGPCSERPGCWFVRSHQAVGTAATLAVGGGVAVLGGGAMVGAAWENAWTYVAVVPEDVARALVPSTEQHTLTRILCDTVGERLIRWPDFAHLDNLGIGEATRTTRMRRGTLGIVVSTMLQNGVGYMSLTGTVERNVWRASGRFVEIADAFTHVTECGVTAGLSVLEKVDMSRSRTQATRVTLRFDLHHPQARELAERIVRDEAALPFSLSPKHVGPWTERFFHDLPPGVTAVNLTAVEQTRAHLGGGLLDAIAKYLKISGLGLSFDVMHDKRTQINQSGAWASETTAHLKQVGVLWLGTSSQLIFVNAQYGTLHGQSEPVFLGLVLGMQYEITKVRGTNRNDFLDDFNHAFGLDIPEFGKIASHSGYYVSVRRLLSADDLERLSRLDENTLRQANINDPKRIKKLLQLRALLQGAHAQSAQGPNAHQTLGGFAPLLLTDAAQSDTQALAACNAGPEGGQGPDADSIAIARSRVMQNEVTGVKTLGALCRWLGGDEETLQVCVRHGACEKPLERMRNFGLEYSGDRALVRADDSVQHVRRRFEQADKLRAQLDRGLEALEKDVLGNALASSANDAVGQKLVAAYVALDTAIGLEHLTPRQKLAVIRQDAIFQLLPPIARAHALCLYDRHGCHAVDADDRQQVRRALDQEHRRITSLCIPANHQRLRDAQLELLREAVEALEQSTPQPEARTWGRPQAITLPDDRFHAASMAQACGDALHKLPAYDIHFLVQDNTEMASRQNEVRETLAAFVDVVRPYDPQGIVDVTFLNEALAHHPPRPISNADEARNLMWNTCGTNAMVGNALEGALQDFIAGVRHNPTHKYAAYVVLTTGAMSDPKVAVDALSRIREAICDFEDEVCVGFLQIKRASGTNIGSGTSIVTALDTHGKVGHMVDSDTQVDRPVHERIFALLHGMLNPAADADNNRQNKAQAVKDTLHRWTHWGGKCDKTA